MIIKWQKKQEQVVIQHIAKIHTEVCEFGLKVGLNSTNKERKYNKEFVKSFIFIKINKWGVMMRSRRAEKIEKLISEGEIY